MSTLRTPLVFALVLASLPVLATDGYFSPGYGTSSKGMGGAGVACPMSALSVASNPASIAFVGNQFDIGLAWFKPQRGFEVKGQPSNYPETFPLTPGKFESGSTSFLVPSVGMNWKLSDKSAFAIAIYGNGGMNTNYDESVFYGGSTGINLSQLFVAPTYAYQWTEGHAIGVSAILAYQQFEGKGLAAFSLSSADPASLTNKGKSTSTGYGLRVGYHGRFSPMWSLGLSYQTRTKMGEFKKYAGLFAEEGGFDIPSSYTAGLAFHPSDSLTFALDIGKINFSEVKSIGNPMFPNLQTTQLGDAGGAGFGWEDIAVYKLGIQWKASHALTLRAGYNHCDQPIPEKEVMFNILAPGVIQDHFTLGATQAINEKSAISFSLIRAFSKSVTGPNPMEAPGAQTITLRMDQWDLEFGYSYRF